DPPAVLFRIVVDGGDLEIRLPRPGRLDDQRERLAQHRLQLALVGQPEQTVIQIALPPNSDLGRLGHARPPTTVARTGRRPGFRGRVGQRRGRNLGSVTSGPRSSNVTSTGMSIATSAVGHPTTFERMRGPSSSSTTTTAYGTSAANPGWAAWCITAMLKTRP